MTTKFEQLIEYVINDEEAKAKEHFHDIIVEKSREIYENIMADDSEEELDESQEEEGEEELDENFGGDASDDLINDVEVEEEGMTMEDDEEFDDNAEEAGHDLTHDMEHKHDAKGGEDLEDRVVDLEDKLDELMAEFEAMMGDGDSVSDIDGGDSLEMDDTDTADFGDDNMMENVTLSAAPKPTTTEPAGTNTKSTVASNSGAKGMAANPVKMTGDTAQGRPAPKAGELIGKVQNSVGGNKKMSPATKPVTSQPSGINTRSPVSKA
jgi:hypothetical protein